MTTLCPNGSYAQMNYLFNVTRQRLFIGHGQVLQPVRTITSCVVRPRTHSVKSEEWCRWSIVGFGTVLRIFFFFPDKRALCNTVYGTASVPSCDTWGLTHVWGQDSGLIDSDASAPTSQSISCLLSLLEYDKETDTGATSVGQIWKCPSLLLTILWYIRQNALELALDHRSPSPKGFPDGSADPRITSGAQAKLRHTFSFPHASPS